MSTEHTEPLLLQYMSFTDSKSQEKVTRRVGEFYELWRRSHMPTLEELLSGVTARAREQLRVELSAPKADERHAGSQEPQDRQTPVGLAKAYTELLQKTGGHPDVYAALVFEEKFAGKNVGPYDGPQREEGDLRENTFLLEHVYPYCLALGHLRALTRPEHPTRYHQGIAEAVILKEAERKAEGPEVDALARELLERLRKAEEPLGLEAATLEDLMDPATDEGMLLYDARAARVLEATGERGQVMAEEFRDKSRQRWAARNEPPLPSAPSRSLWSLAWTNTSAEVTPVRFVWNLARALWHDVVSPRLKRENKGNVRAPTDIAKALTRARGGSATILFSASSILVTPRDCDHQLSLPLGTLAKQDGNEIELRRLLSGGTLKTYFAAWALWCDAGSRDDGMFEWDERHVHKEYFETKTDRHGRAGGRARLLLHQHFEQLRKIKVAAVRMSNSQGEWHIDAETPEALIQRYSLREGQDENVYRHAPLLMTAMKPTGHRVQIPRAVLRLEARNVPLAVGLAVLLRRRIHEILGGPGHHQTTFQELLEELGEDYAEGAQKHGRKYWRKTAQELISVAKEGELGEIHITGEGPKATATVCIGPRLGDAYASILERKKMHAKEDAKAVQTAKVIEAKQRLSRKKPPKPTP